MNELVYVLVRKGVYRHEIGGVHSSKEGAIAAAQRLFEAEPLEPRFTNQPLQGRYHNWEVVGPFVLDLNRFLEDGEPPTIPVGEGGDWQPETTS